MNKYCVQEYPVDSVLSAQIFTGYRPKAYRKMNTKMLQVLLDNIPPIRTVPALPFWEYYETSEAPFTPRFTPPRACARGAHRLAGCQPGLKPPHNPVSLYGEWSEP